MALDPKTRFGVYEVVGPLGAGGMGEVYLAHDTSLGRDVAIKVLPPEFADDQERLRRFEREARVLASLNHPNIAAIYGIEVVPASGPGRAGARALVLELVDGEGLDGRIAGRGLPATEACGIAHQIADALDAAHERGIVHRDLKPANVRLSHEGIVKVLDFGLAKHVAGPDDAARESTAIGPTEPGVVLGTAPYMSPEQARGKAVDKRTDIWAFGCVLYEMLSGRRAFAGSTASDTIAAILEREPDWQALPSTTPARLRRLLARCLEKDPRRRLRDIADARDDLVPTAKDSAVDEKPGADRPARFTWLRWAVPAAALLAGAWIGTRVTTPSSAVTTPELEIERLTFDSGVATTPALSGDGRLLAYASTRSGRTDLDIWIQQATGGQPLRLTDDVADDREPDISADGSQVVFRSDRDGGGAYLVPALGGSARLVVAGARRPRFSPDGTRIAYWTGQFRGGPGRSSTFVLALNGGEPTRVLEDFEVAQRPTWAPDGRSLLVLATAARAPVGATDDIDLWHVPLDGGAPARTHLLDRPGWRDAVLRERAEIGTWSAAGLLLSLGGSVWSVPLDTATGTATHPPRRVLFGGAPAAGPTGSASSHVVFEQVVIERVVERAAVDPAHVDDAAEVLYADGNPTSRRASVTSDGRRLAVEREGNGSREIWVKDTRAGTQQLVARLESTGILSATISPDGRSITYNHDTGAEVPGATGTGYVVDVNGGVPKPVCEKCSLWGFMPDSRRAIATIEDRTIRLIDIATGATTDVLTAPNALIDRPSVSPDGRWIGFRRQEGGTRLKTYVVPVAGASMGSAARIDEPTTTGRPAGWSPDSSILYLLLDTDGFRCLWAQRVDRATGRLVGTPTNARHLHGVVGVSTSFGNAITAQGFVYEAVSVRSSLWRLTAPGS